MKFESASASNEDASNVSDVVNGLELCPCACVYRTLNVFGMGSTFDQHTSAT